MLHIIALIVLGLLVSLLGRLFHPDGDVCDGLCCVRRVAAGSGRQLPEPIAGEDLVLASIAAHKAARMIAKDRVASVIRA